MLEVVHVSCDDPSMEIEFSIDEASTKTVSLTFLRSFTHESPDDNVRTSLFSRLSLPSTCCLSFAVEITDPSHMFGPWICGFPDSRVASYFLDVKTVKTMLDPRETDSSVVTFKTDFLNANNMKLSLVKRSHPLFQDHPAIVTDQYLDFLKSSGVSRSVETLYFEGFPAPLPWGTASEPLSDPLWGFDSLRTLVLWKCESSLFLENPSPPEVWCPGVETLVIHSLPPKSTPDAMGPEILRRVRNIARSRLEHGSPLKSISLFFANAGLLSHTYRRLITELRSYVESLEVLGPQIALERALFYPFSYSTD